MNNYSNIKENDVVNYCKYVLNNYEFINNKNNDIANICEYLSKKTENITNICFYLKYTAYSNEKVLNELLNLWHNSYMKNDSNKASFYLKIAIKFSQSNI